MIISNKVIQVKSIQTLLIQKKFIIQPIELIYLIKFKLNNQEFLNKFEHL